MPEPYRSDILSSMDLFIEKIQNLKGIMLGVSISALVLAPFAIGISVYLVTHPRFLLLVENETEFGVMLTILLTGIVLTSGIWLVTGVRQFRSLSSWNHRYRNYQKKREELNKSIGSKFLSGDEEN